VAIHQRTADRVQTSFQYPIIPPRILARADEVIEQAHRHVGFGTNWTCGGGLMMSVHRDRPEVTSERSKRRD